LKVLIIKNNKGRFDELEEIDDHIIMTRTSIYKIKEAAIKEMLIYINLIILIGFFLVAKFLHNGQKSLISEKWLSI